MALAKAGTTSQAWVGLYNDINSWHWSFHNVSLISTSFSQWYSGQPDNNNGNESCATIGTSGYWWDFPCANRYPFICYNGESVCFIFGFRNIDLATCATKIINPILLPCFTGNYTGVERFVGVANLQLSWLDAQAYCRQFHTDLASAINATDNSHLGGVASQQGTSWFGLYRDTWKWSDGTKASNLTWLPAQPNNYYRPENCGRFNNGPLSDELCTNNYYFFCHTGELLDCILLLIKADYAKCTFI